MPAPAAEPRVPPHPRAVRAAWWSASGACAAAILYLSVIPLPEGPETPWLDKAVHAIQYLGLAWLLVQAIRAGGLREPEYGRLAWICATSYGLLLELLQALVPWRSADLMDALANAAGAAVGAQIGTASLFRNRSAEGEKEKRSREG